MFDERLLQPRQLAVRSCQTLHCYDIAPIDLTNRDEATVDDFAIDQHGASTALAFAASFFGARLAEIFPQHVEEAPGTRSFE
jgi:hypothetical protein